MQTAALRGTLSYLCDSVAKSGMRNPQIALRYAELRSPRFVVDRAVSQAFASPCPISGARDKCEAIAFCIFLMISAQKRARSDLSPRFTGWAMAGHIVAKGAGRRQIWSGARLRATRSPADNVIPDFETLPFM